MPAFRSASALVLALAAIAFIAPDASLAAAKKPVKAPAKAAVPAAVNALARRQLNGDAEGLPKVLPAKIFKAVTVTPDGVTDWTIDTESLGRMGYCGTGGCERLVIVSKGKGAYGVAFDHQVIDFTLTRPSGVAVLDLDVHGTHCQLTGVEQCLRRFTWSAAEGRFVEAANRDGVTRLQGPLLQTVPVVRAALPADVRRAVERLTAGCGNVNASDFDLTIASIPDVNGDGRRDWTIGDGFGTCEGGPNDGAPLPLQILTSAADGGYRVAYSRTGVSYEINIARRPALVVETEIEGDCGVANAAPCPQDTLRWDAATGRFMPGPDGLRRAELARREAELQQQEDELARQIAEVDRMRAAAQDARRRAEWNARRDELQRLLRDLERRNHPDRPRGGNPGNGPGKPGGPGRPDGPGKPGGPGGPGKPGGPGTPGGNPGPRPGRPDYNGGIVPPPIGSPAPPPATAPRPDRPNRPPHNGGVVPPPVGSPVPPPATEPAPAPRPGRPAQSGGIVPPPVASPVPPAPTPPPPVAEPPAPPVVSSPPVAETPRGRPRGESPLGERPDGPGPGRGPRSAPQPLPAPEPAASPQPAPPPPASAPVVTSEQPPPPSPPAAPPPAALPSEPPPAPVAPTPPPPPPEQAAPPRIDPPAAPPAAEPPPARPSPDPEPAPQREPQ